MDVGGQDAAGAEVPELVHDPLGVRRAAPSSAPRPSPPDAAGTRWGSRCRGSARPPPRPARCGCRSPSSRRTGPPGRPRAGAGTPRTRPGGSAPARVTSTASDSRIGSPNDLEPGVAQRAAGLHDVGDHVGDPELHAGLHGAVEPGDRGLDAVLLEVPRTTPAYDVAIRLPARSRDAGRPCRAARRSGTATGRSRAAAPPRPWRRESSSRSRPVMPTSRVPSPTYSAMSRGRR